MGLHPSHTESRASRTLRHPNKILPHYPGDTGMTRRQSPSALTSSAPSLRHFPGRCEHQRPGTRPPPLPPRPVPTSCPNLHVSRHRLVPHHRHALTAVSTPSGRAFGGTTRWPLAGRANHARHPDPAPSPGPSTVTRPSTNVTRAQHRRHPGPAPTSPGPSTGVTRAQRRHPGPAPSPGPSQRSVYTPEQQVV